MTSPKLDKLENNKAAAIIYNRFKLTTTKLTIYIFSKKALFKVELPS